MHHCVAFRTPGTKETRTVHSRFPLNGRKMIRRTVIQSHLRPSSSNFHTSAFLQAGGPSAIPKLGGVIPFLLADIGEGIAECELLKWHVKEGDKIQQFEPLCEVQSDKATVEITSRYDGIVKKLYYKKGDMAKVGSPLLDIDTGGSGSASSEAVNAQVEMNQQSAPTELPIPPPAAEPSVEGSAVLTTPAVRHLAGKHNIDLKGVRGTGKGGRIHKEDIIRHIEGRPDQFAAQPDAFSPVNHAPGPNTPGPAHPSHSTAASSPAPASSSSASPSLPSSGGQFTTVPLNGYARIMAKTMTAANNVPHFGYCDEILMDKVLKLRTDLKPIAQERGVKMSYMPIIIKAVSLALRQYPRLNSSYDEASNSLIFKSSHNIGVAMDTPNGLIVPNIKNVQDKTIFEVAQELNRLQKLALASNVPREDLIGGTFSLSNIGSIGGTYASPVLLLPEVAIGALGKIQRLPRFVGNTDQVIAAHIMNVSWAADHRVIDGATMANFSNLWKKYLEEPSTIILDAR
eukprot:TRINITY_DN1466_c0_g1_i1.p1 TRINITY_DN1466_c0_g1~~TRINITY_DN1466_c0_g1_i1.p1  ORF type:complete len:514 (-),score=141.72 TRINITY_DN1466_c0_g1_i1:61-1602(-)